MNIEVSINIDLNEIKKEIGNALITNGIVINYIKNKIINDNLNNATFKELGVDTNMQTKGNLAILLEKFRVENK